MAAGDVKITSTSLHVLGNSNIPPSGEVRVSSTTLQVLADYDLAPPPSGEVRVTSTTLQVLADMLMPVSGISTTQSATLILTSDKQPIRLTQAATLVLAADYQPIRTTQAVLNILDYTISQNRITQAATLALSTETPCLTRRAQMWRLERSDGEVFAFTTHDEPLTFMGEVYKPCDSLSSTASDSGISSDGSVGDTTITGVFSDDSITEADLARGLFDGAKVKVWLVPWDDSQYKTDIVQQIASGVLGKTSQGDLSFTVEMISPASKLTTRPLLETYTPACRWELGDGRCPVDIEALRVSSTVTAIFARDGFNSTTFRSFADSAIVNPNGYFEFGLLTWTSGKNAGLSAEIKTQENGTFILWAKMPFEIEVGDAYSVVPGCNKTREDHTNKFGLNMVDFGGFPDIPGQDVLTKTPNSKG